jgi:undecaprenyl-diphosphatase
MDWISMLILAVVQGLTEFLPVSSSGHLALAEHFLAFRGPGILFEVVLHGGTLAAILVFYRRRIGILLMSFLSGSAEGRTYALALLFGSVPALAVYLAVGSFIERAFGSPLLVGALLVFTGLILLTTRKVVGGQMPLTVSKGVAIGMAQAVALLPGVSRSGSTIVAARHLGLTAEAAAEFSLLLSVPAQGGALLITLVKVFKSGIGSESPWGLLATGFLVAGLVGYAAIPMLIKALRADRFWMFGPYCMLIGACAVLWALG